MLEITQTGKWRLPDGRRVDTADGRNPGFGAVYDPLPLTLDEQRALLLAKLAEVRWQKSVERIPFGGIFILMDEASQVSIGQMMQAIGVLQALGIPYSQQWKGRDEQDAPAWITLDSTTGTQLYLAAMQRKAGLFTREETLANQLKAAATQEDLDALAAQVTNFS